MIDTHAHLLSFKNVDEIVNSMEDDELEYIVNIGTTVKDSKKGIRLAEKYERVYTTVGIYPEFSLNVKEDDLKIIEELAKHEKVVAIGEIGLDYHNEYDKESQKKLLIKQLEIADKAGLPFCIHCRNAVSDHLYGGTAVAFFLSAGCIALAVCAVECAEKNSDYRFTAGPE